MFDVEAPLGPGLGFGPAAQVTPFLSHGLDCLPGKQMGRCGALQAVGSAATGQAAWIPELRTFPEESPPPARQEFGATGQGQECRAEGRG